MFSLRLSLTLAVCYLSSLAATNAHADSAANGIAAVVNGKVIVKSEYQDALQAQKQMIMMTHRDDLAGGQKAMAEAEAKALDSLVDRELILAEFAKAGGIIKPQYIDDDINTLVREQFKGDRDQFVIELAKSGMTMKKFRELREKMIVVQVMRGRHAGKQTPPTPKQVETYFHKHEENYRDKDMIKFSTISIAKFTTDAGATPEGQKKLAEEIRSKVIAGNDFATMAKTYSQDSKSTDGGDWGWMARKDMKPLMGDAAFAVKNGGVSGVISDDAAYIIIYVDTKKLGAVTPLDKVRTDIEKALMSEEAKSDLDQWLSSLRKAAVIRKFN
jgi:parvulin-like peptidyl-prolyl isomerase